MDMIELKRQCKRKSDYIITLFVTNKLALWLTYLILPTKITPNQVTLLSLLFSLMCAVSYSKGFFLLGALFIFVSHILDCTDGNLARARKQFSPYGKFLDMLCDRVGETAIFVGLAWYFWHQQESGLAVWSMFDGLMLMLYYYLVDVSLSLFPPSLSDDKPSGWIVDGVKVKWGIMEPVIYGFIFFSLIEHVEWQVYLVLPLVSAGLLYQFYKTARWIRSS